MKQVRVANIIQDTKKLNILIIGAGMYVCGRGTHGYGSVLPTLYQAQKDYDIIDCVSVCATSRKSIEEFLSKKNDLDRKFNMRLLIECWPKQGINPEAYIEAIAKSPTTILTLIPSSFMKKEG